MALERASGIVLHPTSLPSRGGIGDFGPAAYDFANFLRSAKQRVWQVLPLSPTGYGNSPYAALSAFAGNPLLVSLEVLAEWGWIEKEKPLQRAGSAVNFEKVSSEKSQRLAEAARNFLQQKNPPLRQAFENYSRENAGWLNDYAAFVVLRRRFAGKPWREWPEEFAFRQSGAMEQLNQESAEELVIAKAIQFAFDEQWKNLRTYCAEREIRIMGDVAIFMNFDSADVWTHPELFELDEHLQCVRVSGVPPDYFSATGQKWGNPLYRWDSIRESGFSWWVDRMRRARILYDLIRLDHFRGFEAYWSIPAADPDAVHGEWIQAPGAELFTQLSESLGEMPFVAEDLGLITKEVHALREKFAMPGMRILQFGFADRGAHTYLPHRFETNTVVYTGTHDNDTTLGWWTSGATEKEKAAALAYLHPGDDGIVWAMIRAAACSVADLCIFPLQDVLELGSDARMNKPSSPEGNWDWRYEASALRGDIAKKLETLTVLTDRDGVPPEE